MFTCEYYNTEYFVIPLIRSCPRCPRKSRWPESGTLQSRERLVNISIVTQPESQGIHEKFVSRAATTSEKGNSNRRLQQDVPDLTIN